MARPLRITSTRRFYNAWDELVIIAHKLYLILVIALATVLATAGLGPGARAQLAQDSWDLCGELTTKAERDHRLPVHLLTAISLVEAGRWRSETEEILAWPWTVTAEGRGRFLPSKAAAIAEVNRLRAGGIRNIDVGCMQINLRYHPQAFESLEVAFDPALNVAYATGFLRDLKNKWGSWTRATGNYHSNTPSLSGRYRAKVYRALYAEKRRLAKARRAARLAEREAKRRGAPPAQPVSNSAPGSLFITNSNVVLRR